MKSIQNTDLGLFLLRLTSGGLMLFHGINKLMTPMESIHHLAEDLGAAGIPEILAYNVFLTEVIAPILLIVGWRSKIWGALIAMTMVFAIYSVYLDDIFKLNEVTGAWAIDTQFFYLMGPLVIVFTGAGRYALSYKHWLD